MARKDPSKISALQRDSKSSSSSTMEDASKIGLLAASLRSKLQSRGLSQSVVDREMETIRRKLLKSMQESTERASRRAFIAKYRELIKYLESTKPRKSDEHHLVIAKDEFQTIIDSLINRQTLPFVRNKEKEAKKRTLNIELGPKSAGKPDNQDFVTIAERAFGFHEVPYIAGESKSIKGASRTAHPLQNIFEERDRNAAAINHFVMALSMGLDLDNVNLQRYLPIRVYLSDDASSLKEEVVQALRSFLDVMGIEIAAEYPEILGSWWKSLTGRFKELMTKPEVEERLRKVEHALELKTIKKDQSGHDLAEAEAAAFLSKAAEHCGNAAFQIGALIFVKTTNGQGGTKILCRTMTSKEMLHIENHQWILKTPAQLMTWLSSAGPKRIRARETVRVKADQDRISDK